MIDEHDKLIGLIYDGIADDSAWDLALAQVAGRVGAVGVGLGMQDMKTHAFRNLGAFGIDPDLNQAYRRLAPYNIIWQAIAQKRQPLTDRMVTTKATFVRTELFSDWFRPQGFHSVMAFPVLFKHDASAVVVAFRNRTHGDFELADLAEIGRFAEHFGRALNMRLDREQAVDLAAATLMLDDIQDAIFLVDRDVRIRHANATARTMLEEGEAIRAHNGRLEIREMKTDTKLAAIVAGGYGGELRLTGPGLRGWTIEVRPRADDVGGASSAYWTVRIMALNRQGAPPTPARLRERLGLTHRQSEVIAELAGGATEAEAAHKLSLGEPTLHTHVRRVYERLDLRSRAELLALLARNGFDTTRGRK